MIPIRHLVLACCAAALFHDAGAQTFRLTDEHGVAHEADRLPATGTLRALEIVEGTAALTPLERRTLEIINEQARTATPPSAQSGPGVQSAPLDPGAPSPPGASAAGTRRAASENARDPCLLSWDPQCYQKNARNYDPRFGYAPSVLRSSHAPVTQTPAGASLP